MRASHDLSRVRVRFDEPNLVPSAGLLPAAALAQRLGVEQLVDDRLTLAAHGHRSGAKALTVLGSMLAGGDSIRDVNLLRTGATDEVFDGVRAPSTIGTWPAGVQVVQRPPARRDQPGAAGAHVGGRRRSGRPG